MPEEIACSGIFQPCERRICRAAIAIAELLSWMSPSNGKGYLIPWYSAQVCGNPPCVPPLARGGSACCCPVSSLVREGSACCCPVPSLVREGSACCCPVSSLVREGSACCCPVPSLVREGSACCCPVSSLVRGGSACCCPVSSLVREEISSCSPPWPGGAGGGNSPAG